MWYGQSPWEGLRSQAAKPTVRSACTVCQRWVVVMLVTEMSTTPPPSCVPAEAGLEDVYEPCGSVSAHATMASAAASMLRVRVLTCSPPYESVREPVDTGLVTANAPVPSLVSDVGPGMPLASMPE